MMATDIDQQLARLARDIRAAGPVQHAPAIVLDAGARFERAERRARIAAAHIRKQMEGTAQTPGDDIDKALELILERLVAPREVEALAA